jgi:hypothetical protein
MRGKIQCREYTSQKQTTRRCTTQHRAQLDTGTPAQCNKTKDTMQRVYWYKGARYTTVHDTQTHGIYLGTVSNGATRTERRRGERAEERGRGREGEEREGGTRVNGTGGYRSTCGSTAQEGIPLGCCTTQHGRGFRWCGSQHHKTGFRWGAAQRSTGEDFFGTEVDRLALQMLQHEAKCHGRAVNEEHPVAVQLRTAHAVEHRAKETALGAQGVRRCGNPGEEMRRERRD